MKFRLLAVLPVLAVGCLGLTACDSKAGTAAVVNGHKISETRLTDLAPSSAKAIPSSDGSTSLPAKIFVLQYLVRNEVFPLLLSGAGAPVTQAELDAQKTAALSGSTEAQLTSQITQLGLSAKFEPIVLYNRELLAVINAKLTTNAQVTKALDKVKDIVSISPRYGSWDLQTVSITDLGKKQLPSILSYDGTLPGDVTPAAQ